MSRWRVELEGEQFDLEDLPRLLTGDDAQVIQDGDVYYLEAAEFEGVDDSGAVHAKALELVQLVNGVGKLHSSSFHDVAVARVVELAEDGTVISKNVFVSVGAAIGRSKVSAVAVLVGDEQPEEPAPGSRESDEWMRAALAMREKQRALALWGGPHDPLNLWKVWEIMRDHSGLAIDSDDRRRFKPALNERTIAGEDARHEKPWHKVEPDTMMRAEAEAFLGDLLKRWLSKP